MINSVYVDSEKFYLAVSNRCDRRFSTFINIKTKKDRKTTIFEKLRIC